MPPPLTVPPPAGETFVLRTYWMRVKVAVTVLALVIVTVQTLPLTELQPDQLPNW